MASESFKSVSSADLLNLNTPSFIQVRDIKDLSSLPGRTARASSQVFQFLKEYCSSKTLKANIQKACPWLQQEQVEEIKNVFFALKNKSPRTDVYKLRKGTSHLDGKPTTLSYLIRENDFIVYTGLCVGSGHSKTVDKVISVDEEGNINPLSHIKLHPEKREIKYKALVEHEYHVRKQLDSDEVLSPGKIYAYTSKKGEKKFSWITPYYNRTASHVIKGKKGVGTAIFKEQDAMPLNTLILALKMAESLKTMHDKGWLHRDIKLENYLVKYDEELFKIEQVAIADMAFSIQEKDCSRIRKAIINDLVKVHLGKINSSLEAVFKRNPLLAQMSKDPDYPSVESYKKAYEKADSKDKDYQQVITFLESLDSALIVGTPNHIAPEIYTTRIYSKQADLYALGFSLMRLKEQLEVHALLKHTVDASFDDLVMRLSHKDPHHRPDVNETITTLRKLIAIEMSAA